MEQDRRTIGLTPNAQRLIDDIAQRDWFADAQDIARFAFAFALSKKLAPGTMHGLDTRWSMGGFDPTGEMTTLVEALFPDSATPVRLIEHFVNEGLVLLHDRLVVHNETPADLMAT